MFQSDIDFLKSEISKRPVKPPLDKISIYAELKRILPPGTPFPGHWKNSHTPYAVEIMDNMSPFSPIRHTVVMKGPQLGFTAIAENIVCYWIDESPAPILFMSATDSLLEEWTSKRLEPAIDSCGFRHKIFAQTENTKTRRTGDKTTSKDFIGGFLIMSSAQSAGKMRTNSVRILIRDEVDGAPAELRTGEGSWLEVSLARTDAWDNRKKILDISTPTTYQKSTINRGYEDGDQRRFLVPCPYCKKDQTLEMGSPESRSGLKGEYEAGILKSAYYLCDHCHEAFFNHHKTDILLNGHWVPTAVSSDPQLRSYQLSALYSPVGMLSWVDAVRKFDRGSKDPEKAQAARNLVLGLPFKESGSRPKLDKVLELRGGYQEGEVPEGVLYLTVGIDVQKGSKTDVNNPARLELEVLGTGAGYRTWSILYKVFPGEVTDPYAGAWEDMNEWAMNGGLIYHRKDGMQFDIKLIFIDCGLGVHEYLHAVYIFCDRWQNTYPSKGFGVIQNRKGEKKQSNSMGNLRRYRATNVKSSGSQIIYEISTQLYKQRIYNHLTIQRQLTEPQRPGFCDFPADRSDKFFKMLTAEERLSDGSFDAGGRRNEALDNRVMAACAADAYLDALVDEEKQLAKQLGASPIEMMVINKKWILDRLESQMTMKKQRELEL